MSGPVPPHIASAVERSLRDAGQPQRIVRTANVGGGCISPAARIEFEDGSLAFLKWAEPGSAPAGFFTLEADSLAALARTETVRVPRVLAAAEQWLLLEWIEPGRSTVRGWQGLGRALARLHRVDGAHRDYGWHADNYIGSLPQQNDALPEWPVFWRERRLVPQLERAYRSGHFDARDRRAFDDLLASLEPLLRDAAAADGPSLLHGDMWRGNVHFDAGGNAALIDPSTYRGHREVDIAMAELFGGFDRAFFDSYDQEWPLTPGYAPGRRASYQLYYLLVHVNLFGASYISGARAARDAALRAAS